jgi:hypothetical protein
LLPTGLGSGADYCTLSCPLARVDGGEVCDCAHTDGECSADADCAVARNVGTCRPRQTCPDVYPVELLESEPCLILYDEHEPLEVPEGCTPRAVPDDSHLDCFVDAPRCAAGRCI